LIGQNTFSLPTLLAKLAKVVFIVLNSATFIEVSFAPRPSLSLHVSKLALVLPTYPAGISLNITHI